MTENINPITERTPTPTQSNSDCCTKVRWWAWYLIGGLILLFLILIFILRGLCSDVWYIRLLGLPRTCGGIQQGVQVDSGGFLLKGRAATTGELTVEGGATINGDLFVTGNITYGGAISSTGGSTTQVLGGDTFVTENFFNNDCVAAVICNKHEVEGGKNFAIQSADPSYVGGQIRGAPGQTADLLQLQNDVPNVLSVFNNLGHLGINTASPVEALDVYGNEWIHGRGAIGPDSTLGTSSIITPLSLGPTVPILPPTPVPAERTLAVQERFNSIPTAATPIIYSGLGSEIYIDSTGDPGSSAFTGSYTSAEVMVGNSFDYPAVSGGASLGVHSGIGDVGLGAGHFGVFYNMSSGDISAGAGVNGTFVNVDSGDVGFGYGLGSYMFNTGTGTITSGGGLYIAAGQTGTGTIDILNGIAISSPVNLSTGTIGLAVGLDVLPQSDTATLGTGVDVVDSINILSQDAAKYSKNIINGNNYFNADINPDFRGDWITNSTTLPVALKRHTAVYNNGYIYVIGGNDGSTSRDEVYYAPIRANGSIGSWTTSPNTLPVPLEGHTSVVANGYIYAIGGNSGAPFTAFSTVYYARINPDGSIGPWATSPNPLPAGRVNHTSVTANGFVYVIAGNSAFLSTDTVFYARLNADGTTGAWITDPNLTPAPVAGHTSVVANGYIYILSGSGTTAIYYTKLNPDGSTNPWSINPDTTFFIQSQAAAIVANGFIYNIGGRFFTGPTDQLAIPYHHRINNDGTIGPSVTDFFSLSDMPLALDGHKALYVNGFIYVIGGENSLSPVDDIFYVSTRRSGFAGAVDLVGLSVTPVYSPGEQLTEDAVLDLVDVTAGAQLTAGDVSVFGHLEVNDSTFINDGLTVNGPVIVGAEVRLQNLTDSTSAFEVLDSIGTSLVNVDTVGGFVGISNSSPAFNLHVGNSSIIAGTTVARFENAGGTCDVTPDVVGAVSCTSDIRVKKNISELTDTLEKIGAIKVYSYNMVAENDNAPVHVGFLAQELEAIMPDLVKTDSNGFKSVSYAGLTPYLVQAIKQQQAQINDLKSQLSNQPQVISINVLTELASANAITVNGVLTVNGRVEFSTNNKGQVKIPAGLVKVRVDFAQRFNTKPSVVISSNDFIDGSYRTTEIKEESFEIELNKTQPADIEFNWQAF